MEGYFFFEHVLKKEQCITKQSDAVEGFPIPNSPFLGIMISSFYSSKENNRFKSVKPSYWG